MSDLSQYTFIIDQFSIATEGLGNKCDENSIRPLTIASLGFLNVKIEDIVVTIVPRYGGGGEEWKVPEHLRWKAVERTPIKSLDEIKDIFDTYYQTGEFENDNGDTEIKPSDVEPSVINKVHNTVTQQLNIDFSVSEIRDLINNILSVEKDDEILEIKINLTTTDQLSAEECNIKADLIKEAIRVDNLDINSTPAIKILLKSVKKHD
jgi:hypothetical protein